jgi:hypothetical protein
MPEQCRAGAANNIKQWYYWNMEPGYDKHWNSGNNNLYIYTICRPMRNYSNTDRCSESADYANIHCNRTAVSELYSAGAANNIY